MPAWIITIARAEMCIRDRPKPGQADYGWTKSKDQQMIMTDAVNTMALEWVQNYYTAYPFGFYKRVSISESDQKAVGEILEKVCLLYTSRCV